MRTDNLDLALAWTAHELRGPLVGARAALGHVHIDDQGPTSDELLQRTREELKQLADLVDPLLQWSAGSCSLDMQQVDLVGTVDHVVASCRMEFDHADLVVRAPDTLVIRADAQQLRRAIANVVRNALAYAPDDSSVTIDVDADGESARVRVRDRGPGVPAAERHLIFDPFARGRLTDDDPRRQGVGAVHRETDRRGARRFHRSSIRPTGDGVLHRAAAPGGGRLRSAS